MREIKIHLCRSPTVFFREKIKFPFAIKHELIIFRVFSTIKACSKKLHKKTQRREIEKERDRARERKKEISIVRSAYHRYRSREILFQ